MILTLKPNLTQPMTAKERDRAKARIIFEIMEARYLRALKEGTDEDVARAEIHLNNAHRKVQESFQ